MRNLNKTEVKTISGGNVFVGLPPSPGTVSNGEAVRCGQVLQSNGQQAAAKCLADAKKR